MTLKISISGVRGIYGQTLTDEIICKFGIAFARLIDGGKVIIGSDTRKSVPDVKDQLFKGLKTFGKIQVIDIGYCPTPTIQVVTKNLKADGGIIVSASHNPKEWNGLKFVRPDGIFLTEEEFRRLIDLYEAVTPEDLLKTREGYLDLHSDLEAYKVHLDSVINFVNAEAIRKANLKVAMDTCCGAGSNITRKLFKALGVEYKQINGDMNLEFCSRGLEPIPENLKHLGVAVRDLGAVAGFALDPDADRLAFVDEEGNPIGEDYTLCLIAEHMFQKLARGQVRGKKIICTNLSTTRVVDDIAKKYRAQVIRTKIGEINVSTAMKKHRALVGGEGNGGIIIPAIGFGRDSLIGMALMLEYLALSRLKVSEMIKLNPSYTTYKTKLDCASPEQVTSILNEVKSRFAKEKIDEQDGVKVIFADGNWLHVRASNTEPIIRIIAEAENLEKARKIAEIVL